MNTANEHQLYVVMNGRVIGGVQRTGNRRKPELLWNQNCPDLPRREGDGCSCGGCIGCACLRGSGPHGWERLTVAKYECPTTTSRLDQG